MQRLLDIFFTEDYELNPYRIFCLLGAFFMVLYGLVLKYIDPTAIDYIAHRAIFSTILVVLCVCSYLNIEVLKKYFSGFVFFVLTSCLFWIIWIVSKNDFSTNYVLGLLAAFCIVVVVYHRPLLIILHAIFSFIVTVYFLCISQNLETNALAVLLALVVVGVLSIIMASFRIRVAKQLELLNQSLEKRVIERTQEIEAKTEELVEKNFELEQFAKAVSHDLKTPLRGISALNNWLIKDYTDKFDNEGKEILSLIRDRTERMDKLLEGIFAYRQIDLSDETQEKINLNELVRAVIEEQEVNKMAKFKIHNLPEITFNKSHIYLVFDNLIHNALIHHHDKDNIKVEVACEEKKNDYEFIFSDNGPGINESYNERIFNLFETLKTKDEGRTTGTGLALVKRIITRAGGKIWVTQEREGATFRFTVKR